MVKQIWLHKKVEKKPNPKENPEQWMALHPKTKNVKSLCPYNWIPIKSISGYFPAIFWANLLQENLNIEANISRRNRYLDEVKDFILKNYGHGTFDIRFLGYKFKQIIRIEL